MELIVEGEKVIEKFPLVEGSDAPEPAEIEIVGIELVGVGAAGAAKSVGLLFESKPWGFRCADVVLVKAVPVGPVPSKPFGVVPYPTLSMI